MTAPVYFTGVRAYFVVTTALAGVLALILLRPDGSAAEARVLLELLTPLPLVLVSAGLLQSDTALALIVATRTRISSLLVARWSLALAGALVVPAALHLVAAVTEIGGSISVLTWLAPAAFLGALSILTAALTTSSTAGIGASIGYWAVSLLLTPVLREACGSIMPGVCAVAVWSSAYGLIAAAGTGWEANRAALLLAAAAILVITCVLYRNPERRVRATVSEVTV